MTCKCGAYFCWKCGKDISTEGYGHFQQYDEEEGYMCNLWDKNVTQYKDEIDQDDIKSLFDGKKFEQTTNVS